jgi:hypothetical protein
MSAGFHEIGLRNLARALNASSDRGATPIIRYVSASIRIVLSRTAGSSL